MKIKKAEVKKTIMKSVSRSVTLLGLKGWSVSFASSLSALFLHGNFTLLELEAPEAILAHCAVSLRYVQAPS